MNKLFGHGIQVVTVVWDNVKFKFYLKFKEYFELNLW